MSQVQNNHPLGRNGFKVVTSANSPATGPFYAIKARGGAATYATTAVPYHGDDLPSAEVPDGDVTQARFQTVTVSSGTVLAYWEEPQIA